jgi:hypothetical protein
MFKGQEPMPDIQGGLEDVIAGIIGYFIRASLLNYAIVHFGIIPSTGEDILGALRNVFAIMCILYALK